MQALKDAGIVLILIVLALSVRITPIAPADGSEPAGNALLVPPAHAAAAPAPEFAQPAEVAVESVPLELPADVVERCAEIVLEWRSGDEAARQFVVMVETTTEDGKPAPCPRT